MPTRGNAISENSQAARGQIAMSGASRHPTQAFKQEGAWTGKIRPVRLAHAGRWDGGKERQETPPILPTYSLRCDIYTAIFKRIIELIFYHCPLVLNENSRKIASPYFKVH